MASSQSGASGVSGVHIPSCGNSSCEPFLQRVVNVLREHQVVCVEDYEYGGLYKDRFQQAFEQTRYTILHVCPELLSQTKRVEEVLKKDPFKAWFVRLQSRSSDDEDPSWLHQFHIKDLNTQEKIEKFLGDLLARFGVNDASENTSAHQTPDDAEAGRDQQPSSPSYTQAKSAGSDDFQSIDVVLRPKTPSCPFINKAFFSVDPAQQSIHTSDVDCKVLAQKDIPTQDWPFFTHVLFPDFCEKKDIVSLAHFSCSPHSHFRLEALHLICRLLLENLPAFSRETLLTTEKILFANLEQSFKGQITNTKEKGYAKEQLNWTDFLVIAYLMLVAGCILKGDAKENDDFCRSILEKPLFNLKKSNSLTNFLKQRLAQSPRPSVPSWHPTLKNCLLAWSVHNTCDSVKRKVSSTVHHHSHEQSHWPSVQSWSLPLKLALLVECFIESFQESKPVFLAFLNNFKPKQTGIKESEITLQRLITSLLIFGTTSFLQQRSEKLSTSENFQSVCDEMIKSLTKVASGLDKRSQLSCSFLMTPLLFSMNKTVRQCVGYFLRQQILFHEYMWDRLLLETNVFVWPMLLVSEIKLDQQTSSHQSWIVVPSTFNGHSAQTHIHRPTGTHQLSHNRTKDKNIIQQDQYFRELGLLKELKHENVVRLVAFHENCCPQFYITEDYLTTRLQSALVNKSRNGHHFTLKRLLTMLLEVLKGIQYCHENNIVHRDLTAGNVFLTADGKTKLSGFKHALKLSEKKVIRDFNLSFVATRWSAPESLQHCDFSLASDMWMVGHLMYEVMTHGRLPYADVCKKDEDLMRLVFSGEKRLCDERCIPRTIHNIIMELTVIRDALRKIPAKTVAARLQQVVDSVECSEDLCHYFPDLSADEQAATKHFKGPVVKLIDNFPGIEVEELEEEEDEIYSRPDPKKSGRFVVPCPESFTSKEWDMLSQEDLPSITKLIGMPTDDRSGQKVLPFMVATSCTLYSLKDVVMHQYLGPDLQPYVLCLQTLAASMAHLHSRRIILCDFSADTVHVEIPIYDDDEPLKVWITSLAQIKMLSQVNEVECHVDLYPPHDEEQRRRAAPEVLQHGQYSPASDVFCFSRLVWWVFNTMDLISRSALDRPKNLLPLNSVPVSEVYENVVSSQFPPIPESCPDHLADLMKTCWDPTISRRPRMDFLRKNLKLNARQISRDDMDLDGYEPISVANASETNSTGGRRSSFSSSISADQDNPSVVPDTDYESWYSESGVDSVSSVSGGNLSTHFGNPSEATDTDNDVTYLWSDLSSSSDQIYWNDEDLYLDPGSGCSLGRRSEQVYKNIAQVKREEPARLYATKGSDGSGPPGDEDLARDQVAYSTARLEKKKLVKDMKHINTEQSHCLPPPLPPRSNVVLSPPLKKPPKPPPPSPLKKQSIASAQLAPSCVDEDDYEILPPLKDETQVKNKSVPALPPRTYQSNKGVPASPPHTNQGSQHSANQAESDPNSHRPQPSEPRPRQVLQRQNAVKSELPPIVPDDQDKSVQLKSSSVTVVSGQRENVENVGREGENIERKAENVGRVEVKQAESQVGVDVPAGTTPEKQQPSVSPCPPGMSRLVAAPSPGSLSSSHSERSQNASKKETDSSENESDEDRVVFV